MHELHQSKFITFEKEVLKIVTTVVKVSNLSILSRFRYLKKILLITTELKTTSKLVLIVKRKAWTI